MVKHTYLKNVKLKVSETIHPSGELHLNEEGIVVEELSLEVSGELTEHPDFVFVPEVKTVGSDQSAVGNQQDSSKIKSTITIKDNEERTVQPEFKEEDTKVVNGKGFVYRKNAKGVLTWLRNPELDEKGE